MQPRFIRLLTTTGPHFVNVNFIQYVRLTGKNAAVAVRGKELFVENASDIDKLSRMTRIPLNNNMVDPYEGKEHEFKLSLWM